MRYFYHPATRVALKVSILNSWIPSALFMVNTSVFTKSTEDGVPSFSFPLLKKVKLSSIHQCYSLGIEVKLGGLSDILALGAGYLSLTDFFFKGYQFVRHSRQNLLYDTTRTFYVVFAWHCYPHRDKSC